MAVYSMTGYASVQNSPAPSDASNSDSAPPTARLGLEIRAVNSRFLDLSFRLSDELRAHEPMLRELLTQRLKRGKVEVRAAVEQAQTDTLKEPSAKAMQRLNSLQDKVRAWFPEARSLSVADVMRLCGSGSSEAHDWSADLKACADTALQQLMASRAREGERLAATLHDRIGQLRTLAQQAAPLVPQLVEQQRQRFLDRWKDAMALADGATLPEAAQDRALTEATAFAIRIDVAEELTRLASHLDELTALLNKGGELGKRLDFLIQELHREANTLGSKSAQLELSRISVDMKVLIEQMREQIQNLE